MFIDLLERITILIVSLKYKFIKLRSKDWSKKYYIVKKLFQVWHEIIKSDTSKFAVF